MPEEYTGPRRCDLCQFEKDLPCIGKDCHSPDLKGFKPKGVPEEGSLKWSISCFTYSKPDDRLIVHLDSESGGTIMVELTPDEIADFANNH